MKMSMMVLEQEHNSIVSGTDLSLEKRPSKWL